MSNTNEGSAKCADLIVEEMSHHEETFDNNGKCKEPMENKKDMK